MTLDRSPTLSGGEWIDWAGGECPVAHDVIVDVRFRDGGYQDDTEAGYWADAADTVDMWMHNGGPSDITAYRVVPQ